MTLSQSEEVPSPYIICVSRQYVSLCLLFPTLQYAQRFVPGWGNETTRAVLVVIFMVQSTLTPNEID